MSSGLFNAFKDAVLILEEVKRLGENIKKLIERVDQIEDRLDEMDVERSVGAVRDEALIAKMEAATRVAAAEAHVHIIERIVRLEQAITTERRDGQTARLPDRSDRS